MLEGLQTFSGATGFLIRRWAAPKAALLLCLQRKKQKTHKKTNPLKAVCALKSHYGRWLEVRGHVCPCKSVCAFPRVLFFSRVCMCVCVCSLPQSGPASTHRHRSLHQELPAGRQRLSSGPNHLAVSHLHLAAQLQRVHQA